MKPCSVPPKRTAVVLKKVDSLTTRMTVVSRNDSSVIGSKGQLFIFQWQAEGINGCNENRFGESARRVTGRMHDYENPKQAFEFGRFSSALQSPRNTGRLLGIQRYEKGPALALPLWIQAASTIRCQRDRKLFCC